MGSIQWVYANGSSWVTLDSLAQSHIESLWSHNSSSWIQSQSFRCPVYVDIGQMMLMCNGTCYSIARRRA
ncbi:uncharacterized protein B0P05DRAFT_551534 [Gilbertella persicaria]|uniref:uncharacterized protein n=1 Tax=Gilbertella persicaria TaxID=101096 RepID=UPI00221E5B12|nr:uncharacterized protein B0P05DRAFT_551534 [Gilbertella persicaria]KAI8069089.1 hypothetical protein B0P05DRAFT_551534 [Gilbertella persicaria]